MLVMNHAEDFLANSNQKIERITPCLVRGMGNALKSDGKTVTRDQAEQDIRKLNHTIAFQVKGNAPDSIVAEACSTRSLRL